MHAVAIDSRPATGRPPVARRIAGRPAVGGSARPVVLVPGRPATARQGAERRGAERRGAVRQRAGRADAATYRRRRVGAAVVLTTVAVGLWVACQAVAGMLTPAPSAAGAVADATPVAARSWVVAPGDTLWGIALASGAHGDIRPYVDRLAAETGDRPLVVGQRVLLPATR